jgi:hypothetical protein
MFVICIGSIESATFLLQNTGHMELHCITTASTLQHFRTYSSLVQLGEVEMCEASYYSCACLR